MSEHCPHCASELPAEAKYCPHCTRIARAYEFCEECGEPIAEAAKRCPHCGQAVRTHAAEAPAELRQSLTATRLGAFLCTGNVTALLHPPRVEIAADRVRIFRWSFFGLRVSQHEIQFDRIASVQYTKGIFWGGLLVETYGGASDDVEQPGFDQDGARELVETLRRITTG